MLQGQGKHNAGNKNNNTNNATSGYRSTKANKTSKCTRNAAEAPGSHRRLGAIWRFRRCRHFRLRRPVKLPCRLSKPKGRPSPTREMFSQLTNSNSAKRKSRNEGCLHLGNWCDFSKCSKQGLRLFEAPYEREASQGKLGSKCGG